MAIMMDIMAMKRNYVDLHCHILPGLDDGSESLADSLTLAQQAVLDGVRYILATPHHLDRHYVNHVDVVQQAVRSFQAELNQRNIKLTIFPGQEVHLNAQLMPCLDDLLGLDLSRHYLLLELPHEMVPTYIDEMIFQLSCEGIVPVIAHPERNAQLITKPQRLYELINQGALAQVTATSLVGTFGKQVQRVAKEFVRCGLVQVVASDAHNLPNRQFAMSGAYHELSKLDAAYPEQFAMSAKNLLNGQQLNLVSISIPKKHRKFWVF